MTRLVMLTLLVVAGSALAAGAEFFVSPAGQDTNPGTADKPFATLERARDAARQLRAADDKGLGGITIWLRGGDYLRTAALELSAADSGTAEAPVVWRAWQDETVRLLGGRTLSAFQPVTDPAVLNRLQEKARAGVRQNDLRALGIHEFGEMKSRGFGRPATPAHCELFCDGKAFNEGSIPDAKTEGAQQAFAVDADGKGSADLPIGALFEATAKQKGVKTPERYLGMDARGGKVYVSVLMGAGCVAVLDGAAGAIQKLIDVEKPGFIRAVNDELVYVVQDQRNVVAVNPRTSTRPCSANGSAEKNPRCPSAVTRRKRRLWWSGRNSRTRTSSASGMESDATWGGGVCGSDS